MSFLVLLAAALRLRARRLRLFGISGHNVGGATTADVSYASARSSFDAMQRVSQAVHQLFAGLNSLGRATSHDRCYRAKCAGVEG